MYVFDTNVWVAALRSRRGASFVILQAMRRELLVGAVSTALFLEYADVLNRAANQQAFWADVVEVDRVLTLLASRLKPTAIYFQWRPQLKDPKDEMVLECAINAGARGIVTFNRQDFLPSALQFGLEVIQPGDFARQYQLAVRLGL
jgi:putative PIN family toxin of toxin-antitoxin system